MNAQIETWSINNRINLYLLNGIDDAHLTDVSASKGRNVGEQFAHLHNVRLMWLKASEPVLDGRTSENRNVRSYYKKMLATSLTGSSLAIEKLLTKDLKKEK
jgi:hypothetical protein